MEDIQTKAEQDRTLSSMFDAADDVARIIAKLAQRAARYAGTREENSATDPSVLAEAFDTLRAQHAELLIADEELRAQIEELQSIERLVAAERARSQTVFTFAPDAYVISDEHGAMLECNQAATRLFASTVMEMIGRSLVSFFAGEDLAVTETMARIALDGGQRDARLTVGRVTTSASVTRLGNEAKLFWRFRTLDEREVTVAHPPRATRNVSRPREAEPLRILVISRDAAVIESFHAAARHFEGKVEVALTIAEALEALGAFEANIVAADLWTEGHLETDVIRELRGRGRRPMPLCIAMSGVGARDGRYAIKAGFHSLLAKPLSPIAVGNTLKMLHRLLVKRKARRRTERNRPE